MSVNQSWANGFDGVHRRKMLMAAHRGLLLVAIDRGRRGECAGNGDPIVSGHRLAEKWPESDEITARYGDITRGNHSHDGDRRWYQKFGLSEGKLFGVMVGGVWPTTS